jgi:carboxylesterase
VSRAARERTREALDAVRRPVDAGGVVQGAAAFDLMATRTPHAAYLLLHGFNDTPQSMRWLGETLHARTGARVVAPRHAGHGVPIAQIDAGADAMRWYRDVAATYEAMRAAHDTVWVVGQSMGGALAVRLVADTGMQAPLVLLAPYFTVPLPLRVQFALLPLARGRSRYWESSGGTRSIHDPVARALALSPGVVTAHMTRAFAATANAGRARLGDVRAPTLYLQSRTDNRIPVALAERGFARLGAPEKRLVWLEGCGHILSVDYCREEIATQVMAWTVGRDRSGGGS